MKKPNTSISAANGAASYQPRTTSWVCTPYATSPERVAHNANQGNNPNDQGKSRLIKANQAKREKFEISNLKFEIALFPFATLRLRGFALNPRHQASIKAKTPAIVPNQGKSSLIKPTALGLPRRWKFPLPCGPLRARIPS